MKRFKSILVVLTEDSLDEVAFERAIHLARTNEAALTLVDVIDSKSRRTGAHADRAVGLRAGPRSPRMCWPITADGWPPSLRNARATPVSRCPRPSCRVCRSSRSSAWCCAKGTTSSSRARRRHPHGRGVLKGFDMHLLRKCPCPVWMLMGPGDGSFDTILAAVDPEPPADPARDKLDRLVLDLATSLAERDDAEVHVAHAWYLQEEQALRHGRYTSGRQDEVDRLVERERGADARRGGCWPTIRTWPEANAPLEGRAGRRDRGVRGGQEDRPDRDGHGRAHGACRVHHGQYGRNDPGAVRCSVIAVKPEGFDSPVTLNG
jgi:universal stress protein E